MKSKGIENPNYFLHSLPHFLGVTPTRKDPLYLCMSALEWINPHFTRDKLDNPKLQSMATHFLSQSGPIKYLALIIVNFESLSATMSHVIVRCFTALQCYPILCLDLPFHKY